jgi:hypothetical protein
MGEAEAVVLGVGGEGAHAPVGEGELAKVVRIGRSCVGHGDVVARVYQCVKTLLHTEARFCAWFRMAVEKGGGWGLDVGYRVSDIRRRMSS